MRKFKIRNSKGIEFDLMREDAFFSSPSGLGTAVKATYLQIGHRFIQTENKVEQKKPSGKIYFAGYQQYEEFVNVIKFTPLTLIYVPYGETEMYLDIGSYELNLGEIEHKSNRLTCSIKMTATSIWYKSIRILKNEGNQTRKKYPYTYPYQYADFAAGTISINNHSELPAGIKLVILGPVKNPSWRLVQNGLDILHGKVYATLPAEHRLVIDSDPETYEIAEYTHNGEWIQDRYEDSDFATERFVYAPNGESTLTFTHEGEKEIILYAEVKENVW